MVPNSVQNPGASSSAQVQLLGDSAQFHCNVSSRVSYSNHYSLFMPPLLGSLVVSAVKILSLESVNAWEVMKWHVGVAVMSNTDHHSIKNVFLLFAFLVLRLNVPLA